MQFLDAWSEVLLSGVELLDSYVSCEMQDVVPELWAGFAMSVG